MKSTDIPELLNEEIRRRTKSGEDFPQRAVQTEAGAVARRDD